MSLQLDSSQVVSTLTSYPYNIVTAAAALGTAIFLIRRHFGGGVCRSKVKLTGKTVIITGANTGIGKQTAIDLAKRKAHVVMACRNVERGQKAAAEVRKASGSSSVEFRHLDLASLSSVRQFVEEVLRDFPQIDILINNAGIMRCPQWKTVDGFEMQFGVNHLGHFLLTNLLLERLKEAPAARIINVASSGYRRVQGLNFHDLNSQEDYTPDVAYFRSKLANVLFTRALAKRLSGTRVTANSLHPGVVFTELGRHMEKRMSTFRKLLIVPIVLLFLKTPWQGAQTTIYCAVAEELNIVSGKYFADCREMELVTLAAADDEAAETLWTISTEMVGLS